MSVHAKPPMSVNVRKERQLTRGGIMQRCMCVCVRACANMQIGETVGRAARLLTAFSAESATEKLMNRRIHF